MRAAMAEVATRAGFVAVLGAPNVGKSTLVNRLVGAKVAIVSPKVQTTRSRLRGIRVLDEVQLVFVDTPGIFAARHRFERAMVHAAWSGASDADAILLLVDAKRGLTGETRAIVERLRETGRETLVALNKIDLVPRHKLLPLAAAVQETGLAAEIFMVSALDGDGVGRPAGRAQGTDAGGPLALSRRPAHRHFGAPAGGRDHARAALPSAAPGASLRGRGGNRRLGERPRRAPSGSSR